MFFFFIFLEYAINVAKFDKKHRASLGDSVLDTFFLLAPVLVNCSEKVKGPKYGNNHALEPLKQVTFRPFKKQ